MDKDIRLYVIIFSYVIFAGILISIPFRRMKIKGKLGNRILELKASFALDIPIYVFSLALISILWFREFGYVMDCVLAGCGIFAGELATKDISYAGLNGVYNKGVLFSGLFIEYDDMITFPVMQLPPEEQKNYSEQSLVIATKSLGNKTFIFKNKEEKDSVVNAIVSCKPELKV